MSASDVRFLRSPEAVRERSERIFDAGLTTLHEPGSEVIVEWRALTVALLDRVAEAVRDERGLERKRLPLAKVLEGGTWRAGRRFAEESRVGGPATDPSIERWNTVLKNLEVRHQRGGVPGNQPHPALRFAPTARRRPQRSARGR